MPFEFILHRYAEVKYGVMSNARAAAEAKIAATK